MAIKTFTTGEVLTASDTNTYLANAGLVYVTSTTVGSAVSTVTISNCFSSTYDAYRIIYTGGASSAGGALAMTLGSTTTGYASSLVYQNTASSGSVLGIASTTSGANWLYIGSVDTTSVFLNVELINPYLAEHTYATGGYVRTGTIGSFQGVLADTTSYTSFTLDPEGAITLTGGTVTVYGYRKA